MPTYDYVCDGCGHALTAPTQPAAKAPAPTDPILAKSRHHLPAGLAEKALADAKVRSKKVTTAPSTSPLLTMGWDQYSTGKLVPSARQKTSSSAWQPRPVW